ncbi:MAG: hypothetical protein K9N40_07580, partial [Candidatus Cloacimonetes bacterium]|nr:hypothetical protein [Candidatus Cloacimonadota bacterium]
MFIRKKEVVCKKTGKKYQYCKLVETVQTENGARQRMILHLGELDLTKAELKSLGKLLEMRISGKQESSRLPSLSDL